MFWSKIPTAIPFDKVNHSLYNAFCQPFDEGIFADTNYEVDIRNGILILTSNFATEAEIKQGLGTAMYSRIGACIAFDDLPVQAKQTIAQRHFDEVYGCLDSDDKAAIDSTDYWSVVPGKCRAVRQHAHHEDQD